MPSALRSANHTIATAVGLMVLVCTVVGVLGWRLLSQEHALANQRVRDRLQRTAEQIASKFTDRMQQLDAWLGANAPLQSGGPPTLGGAIVVWVSNAGVHVAPLDRLLYYPVIAGAPRVDAGISAEAMLEEARALGKQGDVDGALSKYDDLFRLLGDSDLLVRETGMSGGLLELLVRSDPSRSVYFSPPEATRGLMQARLAVLASRVATLTNASGVPYRLLIQFERAQLLASAGRREDAQEHARRLVSEMSSGRWTLDKATFTVYDSAARKIAGLPPPPAARVAVSEQVVRLWNEWRASQHHSSELQKLQNSQPRSIVRIWNADPPLVALVNKNPDRLVALIVDGDSFPSLGLDLSAAGENVGASVVDDQGRLILGEPSSSTGVDVVRALTSAGLPWRLRLIDNSGEAGTIVRARRNYAMTAFLVFVLLVAGACYAIARGVLREAEAGQLQGDFVSAVSHEFRSPLTAMRQLTELLAQGRIQDESRRRVYFEVLEKETSRLHRLVEDLLDFGRMNAGRRHYRVQPIDLSRLVDDAINEYRREADANGHRIDFVAHNGGLVVDADNEALKRAVRNLLENAVKYSPDATIVWVETAAGDDGTALLRVRDEGIGVPHDEQSRIFEKFVRGEAAKHACIQGTGIGLSMVKEIVGAHDGQVTLQSEVGRGSTFTVQLPLSRAHIRGVGRDENPRR
jgi:signal transduction histidine kinase